MGLFDVLAAPYTLGAKQIGGGVDMVAGNGTTNGGLSAVGGGGLSGYLGFGGGASGSGFSGPQGAAIDLPVNQDQINASYGQNQSSLLQQQNLLNALGQQNGISNQTNVYNQLQGVVNGTGPNPAQAMLAQQTGANVANQSALMAGQRGASANAGLLARQAAQQGAATQQQAAGQGATLQAQQSLNALGQAGNMANTQVANQLSATNAVTSAQQAEQANLLNAMGAYNQASVGSQGSVNAGNTSLANTTMQGQQGLLGGLLNSAGGASSMTGGNRSGAVAGPTQQGFSGVGYNYSHGGRVSMADGGGVPNQGVLQTSVQEGPQSSFGQFISGVKNPEQQYGNNQIQSSSKSGSDPLSGLGGIGKMVGGLFSSGSGAAGGSAGTAWAGEDAAAADTMALASKGGKVGSRDLVDVVVSPGEKIVPPGKATKAAGGKVESKTVPGKAEVKGDSVKNDVVKTKLPPGTIVIPRTKSKDSKSAANFVRATLAKRGRK